MFAGDHYAAFHARMTEVADARKASGLDYDGPAITVEAFETAVRPQIEQEYRKVVVASGECHA